MTTHRESSALVCAPGPSFDLLACRSEPSAESGEHEGLQSAHPVVVPLWKGGSVVAEVGEKSAQLTVRAGSGQAVTLEIRFDAHGPVVSLAAEHIEMCARENLSLACRNFDLRASENIDLHCGGKMRQSATESMRVEAAELGVRAHHGSIALHANDDVKLTGEMILLNCDRPGPPVEDPPPPPYTPAALPAAHYQGDPELQAFLTAT